jgi:hypothetical protein
MQEEFVQLNNAPSQGRLACVGIRLGSHIIPLARSRNEQVNVVVAGDRFKQRFATGAAHPVAAHRTHCAFRTASSRHGYARYMGCPATHPLQPEANTCVRPAALDIGGVKHKNKYIQ